MTSLDRVPERLRAFGARAPWLIDAALIVGIVALSLRGPHDDHVVPGAVWSLVLALPLLARRRWPVAVFGAIAAIAFAQWLADVRAFGDSALLVAFYTVAVTQAVRSTVLAALVLETGVVLAALRWAGDNTEPNAFVALSAFATAAGVMGINVRNRRALLASLEERATRLERERDQQGRLAAAGERARIAREMHDIVAHNLSVMIALADGAGFMAPSDPAPPPGAMEQVSKPGRHALGEMRRLLGVLRADGEAALAPQPGLADLDVLL